MDVNYRMIRCGQRSAPAPSAPSRPGRRAKIPIKRGKERHRERAHPLNKGFHRSRKNQDVKAKARTPRNNVGDRHMRSDGAGKKALLTLKTQRPEDLLTRRLVTRLVKYHYHNYGMWAGEYRLRYIAKMRLERRSATRFFAHVRYRYKCRVGRCSGTFQQGFDQRIFYLSYARKRWTVTRMGGYMSARLSP